MNKRIFGDIDKLYNLKILVMIIIITSINHAKGQCLDGFYNNNGICEQ